MRKKSISENKRNSLLVRIPVSLNKRLTEYISEIGISKTAFICNLIYNELQNKNQNTKMNEGNLL